MIAIFDKVVLSEDKKSIEQTRIAVRLADIISVEESLGSSGQQSIIETEYRTFTVNGGFDEITKEWKEI